METQGSWYWDYHNIEIINCDVVRLSTELVGHRSIWRRPKYLRLCFADNYWSRFIVEEATIHTVENCLVWVQLKIDQARRDNIKVVPNMWTNASDFSGWRSPAQFPNHLLHNYL